MKKLIFSLFILGVSHGLFSQTVIKNFAFQRGESLTYRVHYGIIDAGEVNLSISADAINFGGTPTYHVVGLGTSNWTFDRFYKVRDRYDSFISEETLLPQFFIRKIDEGGWITNQEYMFNQKLHKATVKRDGTDQAKNIKKKEYNIPDNTQDILSAFYHARNIDFTTVNIGSVISIPTFFDEELIPMQVKVLARETIKTKFGKIRCIKLCPIVQEGRVFKEKEDLLIWVSDDLNRIPVRLQANVVVGSVKMDLKDFKNLRNPLAIEK